MDDFVDSVLNQYKEFILRRYPNSQEYWPIISGHDVTIGWHYDVGQHQDNIIIFFKHTANTVVETNGIGNISSELVGTNAISDVNINQVRERLERHFQATLNDAVFIVKEDMSNLQEEMEKAMQKHEHALDLVPMKIFLSHKGVDKPKIREYKETLKLLDFDPWLDEEAMSAGTERERGLLRGFQESCGAVFFVTPNFRDEQYLATEINYAIEERNERKGRSFLWLL